MGDEQWQYVVAYRCGQCNVRAQATAYCHCLLLLNYSFLLGLIFVTAYVDGLLILAEFDV